MKGGNDFDPDAITPNKDDTSDDGCSSNGSLSSGDDLSLDAEEELGEWVPDPDLALAVFNSILES